jgi:hypothetical protein
MAGRFQQIANFFGFGASDKGYGSDQAFIRKAAGTANPVRNLSNEIFPQSFIQARIDLASWAAFLEQAEQASYPFRVDLQKMYVKTLKNGHVASCVQRRKELTLLRDFQIENANGEYDKKWTEYFKLFWYKQNLLELMLDADYHGFTLASIGEIKDGVPGLITNIKRWNISPDREHVSVFEKSPAGYSWNDPLYEPWHLWMPTVQLNGINNCGYGLLYIAAALEILQRNNVQYNADFIEMFAQPYRWLKTNDLDGDEFEAKKKMMREMASAGFGITGLNDELEFLNDGSRGNGYKAYNDFDHRAKADISKWIGGHADFIDSIAKGMDTQTGGGDVTDDATGNNQIQRAAAAKRTIDGDNVTYRTNEILIPKLQRLGVDIPRGHKIHFLNDSEERSIAAQEADKNQKIATLALSMAQGGLQMDEKYFTEQTKIPCKRVEVMPDKNVLKEPKEQAAGKGALKDKNKARADKPKHTR